MITKGQIFGEEEAYVSYLHDRARAENKKINKKNKKLELNNDSNITELSDSSVYDKIIRHKQFKKSFVRCTTMICNSDKAEIWQIPYRVILFYC